MSQTAEQRELVNSIESLLVEGFRKLQSLVAITKEERTAFLNDKVAALEDLVDKKEVLLDDLNQIENHRQTLVEALAEDLGLTREGITLAKVLPALEATTATRLKRLSTGVLALAEEARALTSGNHALAVAGLDRVDAMQTFLLNFFDPPASYQPTNRPAQGGSAPVWDVERRV